MQTTPTGFNIHQTQQTEGLTKELLEKAESNFGFLPNFMGVAAESAMTLKAYVYLAKDFEKSTLSAEDRQVVFLTASMFNDCDFCISAHTAHIKNNDINDNIAESIRNDQPVKDKKLEALRQFTHALLKKHGSASTQDLKNLTDAGYNHQQALEVTIGLAAKTISNFVNNMAQTPLNAELAEYSLESTQKAA